MLDGNGTSPVNAFQLIGMSASLDLSGFFENEVEVSDVFLSLILTARLNFTLRLDEHDKINFLHAKVAFISCVIEVPHIKLVLH